MGIPVKQWPQAKARNSNPIFPLIVRIFLALMILQIAACAPRSASQTPIAGKAGNNNPEPDVINTATSLPPTPTSTPIVIESLTFLATADAYVKQSEPDTNFGIKSTLKVDHGGDPDESFIRFTVTEVSGPVQRARLRLYNTTNGSKNGPAVYLTGDSWSEDEITWNNRPAQGEDALENKDQVDTESWVEYDVTSAVTGSGTVNFILAADSGDAVAFSSREGSQPPELVVTFISDGSSAATPTASADEATFVGAGDISLCDDDNDEHTAQLLDTIPGTVFTTGDNAYADGTYEEFMDCYDPTWGRHKNRTMPVPGNHEYHAEEASGYYQYFKDISPYYAYNLGSWRIYALNSEIDIAEDSPQLEWLRQDLTENPRQCVLAYWHQPRWSSGTTHGNSKAIQAVWQILFDAGAELVLNGHEHNYERFMPMDSKGLANPLGLREIVIGTGGADFYPFGDPLPTSEVRNNTTYGVLKLTLRSGGYDWQFIPVTGSTFSDSGSTDCH